MPSNLIESKDTQCMIVHEPLKTKSILDFPISIGSYNSFLEQILCMVKSKFATYICVANVHMIIEAYKDKQFRSVVENANMVTPDGIPLTWSLSIFHKIKQERVAGMDLLPDLLKILSDQKCSVFFYGGSNTLLDETHKFLQKFYPSLHVAGTYSPPFYDLNDTETDGVVAKINAVKPDIVFVILGCPKQEKWMANMKNKISCCMIGVGGALPVMIGLQKRAPGWMQRSGLEWFYRFCQEPKRLFKRYTVTNSLFFYLLMRELVKKSFYRNVNKKTVI